MAQTTLEILTDIAEKNTVTEKQVNLITRRLNNGESICLDIVWDITPELTPEQNNKGLKYLKNLWKTPLGKERKNNPFGYRETEILENFTHFELAGVYSERGNFYVPLYNCCSKDNAFQYYMSGGKIQIVG